ncbi:MAG: DNA/RNA non-specific endonuclease [Janthinobacterium lividum]
MSRPVLLSVTLIVSLSSRPAHAEATSCLQFFPGGRAPTLTNPKLTQRTTLLCNDAFALLASGVTHGPLWSAEHPTTASLEQASHTQREGTFHSDDRIPQADQAQLEDYRKSGYDRGHMTPSGDMPGEQAQQQSFSLANLVPQAAELNRGIWAHIESAVRKLAEQEGELYLITGPAFRGDQIKAIGPNGVLVPTSTWKAVYDPRIHGTGVYVCKNTDQPTCDIVSVTTLIRVAGIDPFPALPDSLKQTVMALPLPEQGRHLPRRGKLEQKPQATGLAAWLLGWLSWLLRTW